MPKQIIQHGRRWYAIHTYSGYEENVADNLNRRIESYGMEDKIFTVMIPTEKKIKIKNGKRKVVTEKIFPGYVLVEMIVTDDSWSAIRRASPALSAPAPRRPRLTRKKSRRFKNGWVLRNRNIKLTPKSATRRASPTARSKTLKARFRKSIRSAAKSKCWLICLDERHRWNWTFCRLKRFKLGFHEWAPPHE